MRHGWKRRCSRAGNPASPSITRSARDPDFAAIHKRLRGSKYVTLQLLWEEYRLANPEGYRYSRFCELYQRWRSKLDMVLRQEHKAGKKMFVDRAGATIPVHDRHTGLPWQSPLFVAALGASSYTYLGRGDARPADGSMAARPRSCVRTLDTVVHCLKHWGGRSTPLCAGRE